MTRWAQRMDQVGVGSGNSKPARSTGPSAYGPTLSEGLITKPAHRVYHGITDDQDGLSTRIVGRSRTIGSPASR